MKPVPETVEALRALHLGDGERGDLADLERLSCRVEALVPTCTGMSIAQSATGITLTFVTPGTPLQRTDPLDFLIRSRDGEGATRLRAVPDDPTDEEAWRLHATADASAGVSSTLSLPLVEEGEVLGSVTLYGEHRDTFAGREEELAAVVGAWAPGATSNDDLWFSSRLRAAAAPTIVAEQETIDVAVGLAAARLNLRLTEARRRLREASTRAGISEPTLARLLLNGQRGS